jgi:hypothetical protein
MYARMAEADPGANGLLKFTGCTGSKPKHDGIDGLKNSHFWSMKWVGPWHFLTPRQSGGCCIGMPVKDILTPRYHPGRLIHRLGCTRHGAPRGGFNVMYQGKRRCGGYLEILQLIGSPGSRWTIDKQNKH